MNNPRDMSQMSSVDVVVPCYNYARYLGLCVDSILKQEGVEVRILIIDDASTDDTEEIGCKLAETDPRVSYRRHQANQGHIATYNEGLIGWASAKYSLLLSADDALTPGALARAAYLMDRYPEVGMTYGMALIIADNSEFKSAIHPDSNEFSIVSGTDFLKQCFLMGNPVPTPTAVVRTELQRQFGGYKADLPHSGDMEMWMRFAVHGSVGILRAVQGYYRKHNSNMSLQYYRQVISDRREVLEACKEVIRVWGTKYRQSNSWLEILRSRLAEDAFWSASRALDEHDLEKYWHCLQFAAEAYPPLRQSRRWWRLRAKRILGRHVVHLVQSLYGRKGRTSTIPIGIPISSEVEPTKQIGWWPESR